MIGLTGTNARPSIAPTFGVENMLGTNPLVFAMPTDEDVPVHQRLRHLGHPARQDRAVGPRRQGLSRRGWSSTRQGKSTTDSVQILKDLVAGTAALTPIGGITEETGGYKGYGFATVVEILSAALSQGAFLKQLGGKDAEGKDVPIPLGHFFMAIDIECFTDLAAFKKTTGDILRALRASQEGARARSASTPAARRSTSPGRSARTRARRSIAAVQQRVGGHARRVETAVHVPVGVGNLQEA